MTPDFMNDKGKGDYLLLKMRMLFSHEHNVLGVGQCYEADEIAEVDDYLNKIRQLFGKSLHLNFIKVEI